MRARAYRFLGTTIGVASDDATALDWLDEFLTPAFDRCDGEPSDVEVVIRTDGKTYDAVAASRPVGPLPDVPCFALDQRVSRRPHWTVDGRVTIADDRFAALYLLAGRRVEILAPHGALRFRTGAMRVICELAAARALVDPCRLQLHAAALVVQGRGVLLAGPKTAGKTTLLSRLTASTRAGIMANDRSLLSFSENGVEVRGVPTSVKVRPWTLEHLPGLFSGVAQLSQQAFLTLAELAAAAGGDGVGEPGADLKLSPAQFAHTLGGSLAPCAMLSAAAFPEHHPDPSGIAIDRLSPADAERRLLQARFGLHSGKTGPTVFERLVAAARADGADEALIRTLATAVPCFAVRIGASAYGRAATAERVVEAVLG